MIKGYAYIAWNLENDPFVSCEALTPRYIAQETETLLLRRPDEVTK